MKILYAKNASRLHKKVGDNLSVMYKARQEVTVKELFPEHYSGQDRYDWVLPGLKIIIETHGIQHYQFSSFGAIDDKAIYAFKSQKFRDERKKEVALLNNWIYIEIPYTDESKITEDYINKLITSAISKQNLTSCNSGPVTPNIKPEISKYEQDQKRKAKEFRRKQYEKQKILKDKLRREKSGV